MNKEAPMSPIMRRFLLWLLVVIVLCSAVYLLREILLPFVAGLLIAYFFHPLVDVVSRRCKCSRNLSTLVVLGLFFIIVIAGLILLAPMIYRQLMDLLHYLPVVIEKIRMLIEEHGPALFAQLEKRGLESVNAKAQLKQALSANGTELFAVAAGFFKKLWSSGMAVVNLVSLLVVTPMVAFYCLRDWHDIVERLDDLLPRPAAETTRKLIREMDGVLAAFVRGQTNVCLILATYYVIALSVVGLDFSLIVGLVAGLLAFIPYLGTIIGTGLGLGIAYVQFGDWTHLGIVFGIFMFAQFVEGNFITPNLVGGSVGLHPAWVIFGMLAGGTLLGFVGVLIAVPVSAMVGVLIRFAIRRYKESDLYQPASA